MLTRPSALISGSNQYFMITSQLTKFIGILINDNICLGNELSDHREDYRRQKVVPNQAYVNVFQKLSFLVLPSSTLRYFAIVFQLIDFEEHFHKALFSNEKNTGLVWTDSSLSEELSIYFNL